MQRKFFSNLILLLLLNLLIKPAWILGIDRSFQNQLGFASYGDYANIFSFSLILSVILDLGMNNFVSSTIAKQPERINELYLPLLFVKIFFGLVYIIITLAAGWLYGYNNFFLVLLLWLCINQLIAYIATFNRSFVSGLQLYKTDAWLSIIDRFTMLLLGIFIVWIPYFPVNLNSFIGIQTVGYLMVLIASLLVLMGHLKYSGSVQVRQQIYPVFRQALPYALLALLMMCYSRVDMLILKKLHINGSLENGVYAAGGRLFDAANMFAVLIGFMLLPAFSANLSRPEELKKLVRSTVIILPGFGLFVSAFCYVYRLEIMQAMYHEANSYTASVFGTQMFSYTMMCGMYVFGTLLTAGKELKLLNGLAFVALILNVVGNCVLVPEQGALACARVGLATHTFICITNFIFAVKRSSGLFPISYWAKYTVLSVCSVVMIVLFGYLHFSIILAGIAGCAVWIILVFVLQLVNIQSVLGIFMPTHANN